MWIVLLLVGAFIVWHFIPQPDPNRPAPRFRQETRAVPSDPDWVKLIEEHCESPAETAFLRAMIQACDLKPDDGSLIGAGVQLDFQVEEGRYRVDFLANKWLVIEIDGAAWHSSPEAIARDKVRDEYLESLGYTVLRIPAKIVFNHPSEAVERVQAALRKGRRAVPVPVKKTGWQRLAETASAIGEGLSEMTTTLQKTLVVETAVRDAKAAAGAERQVVEAAICTAQMQLETEDQLAELDEEARRLFDEAEAFLADVLHQSPTSQAASRTIEVKAFPAAPLPHHNPEYHLAIQAAYSLVAEERAHFLAAQRRITL
ncbi:endonuclease domain-containing protein [Novosphingobium aerophilum]|uniref:DUF559 domain-containing protein n=1 Tax=Novosphingobium aerophilum TaxID=2839843 RepID=A0A7X1KDX3_9SPHN|nr:DUF559 domain-containing protein [Novosphingobium aerophilum]MBC2653602.1 DUF559 domain-containing protein [Novosphingobium aerophilum]